MPQRLAPADVPTSPLGFPLRSEAFAEDIFDPADTDAGSPPWTLGQAAVAVGLCAVPVALSLLGGALSMIGAGA